MATKNLPVWDENFIMYGCTKVTLPKYIKEILKNVRCTGVYRYRLVGVNQYRPSYGIFADMDKLIKWAERHHASCEVIQFHQRPHDYYVEFHLTDPVAFVLEKLDII